jgi:ankyrin repeat protein
MPFYDGTAPIHLAAAEGYIDVIKVLVEKGANVELEVSIK